MNITAGRFGVVGHARVIPGVPRGGASDAQRAELAREIGCDVDLVVPIVIYHAIVVVPKDELWRLGALNDGALQHHTGPRFEILLRGA